MMWDRKYVHFLGMALVALPEEKRRLGAIFFLVILGHLAAFWFIHISYPTPRPAPVTRTHITLFTPELADEVTDKQKNLWYDFNDPSRLIRIKPDWLVDQPLDIKLISTPVASQKVMLPAVEELLFLPDHLASLPKRALESLSPPHQNFHYEIAEKPATADKTMTFWEEGLRSRWVGDPWSLPSVTTDLLDQSRVTVLVVAVNDKGAVEDVLIEENSGKSDIDLMAVESARKLHFQPDQTLPRQWGKVSIFWKFLPATPESTTQAPEAKP